MRQQRIQPRACRKYADRLVDLSDGELPSVERASVEAHVVVCSACRNELHRLDASLAALRDGMVAPSPVTRQRRQPATKRMALLGAGASAAAIVLAIGVVTVLRAPPERGREHRSPHAPREAIVTRSVTPTMSPEAALQHIALVEQQARLEMSLALVPDDTRSALERAAADRLLNTFRQATAVSTSAAASDNDPAGPTAPLTGETL